MCKQLVCETGRPLLTEYRRLSANHPTLAIAKSIDAEMLSKYTVRAGIENAWSALMNQVLDKYKVLEEEIRREIECMGGSSRPGSPMDTSLWRRRSNRMETRFSSTLGSEGGFTLRPLSSLQRRGGSTGARSGPKAANAPSCPLKNALPKQTVARSTVQPKPQPAVRPRIPTNVPQPRAPSPAKQVVPRPAVSGLTGS